MRFFALYTAEAPFLSLRIVGASGLASPGAQMVECLMMAVYAHRCIVDAVLWFLGGLRSSYKLLSCLSAFPLFETLLPVCAHMHTHCPSTAPCRGTSSPLWAFFSTTWIPLWAFALGPGVPTPRPEATKPGQRAVCADAALS